MTPIPRGTRTLAAAALRDAAGGEVRGAAGLRILDGPWAGCRLALGADETLGRGAGASLRLPDPAASRLHLRLRPCAGGVRAEDLGSKNGWTLNGRRRGGARLLRDGDVIAVGATRLSLEVESGPCAPAPRRTASPAAARVAAAALLVLAALALALRAG